MVNKTSERQKALKYEGLNALEIARRLIQESQEMCRRSDELTEQQQKPIHQPKSSN